MQTLFISDIHLSASSKDILACFLQFLQEKASSAQALYILGDLFNVWIGDDNNAAWIQEICQALKNLPSQGVKLYLMQGNRDFLLGKAFAEKCGAELLPDPTVIDLYGVPTLLTHGDLLCTEDQRYQRWRKFSHHDVVRKFFLSLPLAWRQGIANKVRNQSSQYIKQLTLDKMDVTLSSLEAWIGKYQVKQIIHGHTHRPAVHKAQTYTRFVLPDWHPKGGMVAAKPNALPELIFV